MYVTFSRSPPSKVVGISWYNFTNLPFYGFTTSSSSRSSTLIHYAFTHLPFYSFTVFSCSCCPRKKHKFTTLRFYFGFLRFHTSFTVLRFYGFTTFSCPRFAHRTWIEDWSSAWGITAIANVYALLHTIAFFRIVQHFWSLKSQPPVPSVEKSWGATRMPVVPGMP